MAANEQATQLPVIWLLCDVVWVAIGHITSHATKQAEDYNCEPLVHFVILSNSARQAGLFSQWKIPDVENDLRRRRASTIRNTCATLGNCLLKPRFS